MCVMIRKLHNAFDGRMLPATCLHAAMIVSRRDVRIVWLEWHSHQYRL